MKEESQFGQDDASCRPVGEDVEVTKQSSDWNGRSCLTIVGSACAFFCSIGFLNAYGVFQTYYQTHQLKNRSESTNAWIGSFQIFAMFAGALFVGPPLDKFGPRIFMVTGSITLLIAIFMVSLCDRYYQFFLAQGVLTGFSMSLILCPALITISKTFRKSRALAMGLVIAGSSLGGVIWPIELDRLLHDPSVGFAWTIRISGFMMMPLLAIACFFVRLPPQTAAEKNQPHQKPNLSFMKHWTFLSSFLGIALCYFGFWSPFFFLGSYAIDQGISSKYAFYLISILNGLSLFGRIGAGLLADRYGPYNMFIISALLSGIIAFCWTTATSVAGVTIFAAAFGLTSGSIVSLQGACVASIAPVEAHGAAVGLLMGGVSIAALFGLPITGQLVRDGYIAVSTFAGATLLAGCLVMVIVRVGLDRRILAAR